MSKDKFYTIVRQDLLTGKISPDELTQYKNKFEEDYVELLKGELSKKEVDSYIRLCLDYYAYSSNGSVLITDHEYDLVMNFWKHDLDEEPIIYPDVIVSDSTWGFIKHEMPGMVGTVSKVYSPEELDAYLNKYRGIDTFVVAPKYDGISTCIKVQGGKIVSAVTRADGITGQNITPVVQGAGNSSNFAYKMTHMADGYYKCELCVGQLEFEELITEKVYLNRRSATSGIINSPKNLMYAKYVTIIPLLYNDGHDHIIYHPEGMWVSSISSIKQAMKEIYKMLAIIKNRDFPYRTDGVILYPISKNLKINDADYMQDAKAYKINTAEGRTKIKFVYMSIGRMGMAMPMVKVEPVEVNETIVEDVSLGSYDKYAGLDLHEDEIVIIYSAGDVIPQLKLPDPREYSIGSEYLKLPLICPYCNERLERIGANYFCTNDDCPRRITGRITNFISKLGAENISDKTIELLYENHLIKSIEDLFDLTAENLKVLSGVDSISAHNIIDELHRIFDKDTPISNLFGALGISNISNKKARKIFSVISIDELLNKSDDRIYMQLINANGIGEKTSQTFINFLKENHHLIKFLIKHMHITKDQEFKGNIVFTGFRSEPLEENLREIGYDVSDNVNKNTIAVVSASNDFSSTKCISARKHGIDVISLSDIDILIENLKSGKIQPKVNTTQANSIYTLNHYDDISGLSDILD